MNPKLRTLALMGVLFSAAPAACTAQMTPVEATSGAVAAQAVTPPSAAPLVTGLPDFTALVDRVGPAVVNISAETAPRRADPSQQLPPGLEDFLRRFGMPFPGVPEGPRGGGVSLGSGFVISADGYVLTNHHVIAGADTVKVTLSDRRELEAEVVGSDEQYDVALLKIEADGLRWMRPGNSESLKPGQWVIAIGSPFGLDQSVTAGIVSAVGRSNPYSGQQYVPFIQTDVAINRGNSGGPLLNTSGEVVGINSQIFSNSGGYMGVSFAIPIDLAMNAVEQIKQTGQVSRGRIGVVIQPVSTAQADAIGLPDTRGALVTQVEPGSAADDAGLRRMDVIRSFNGTRINDASDLPPMVGLVAPGTRAELEVFRDGRLRNIDLTIGGEPADASASRGSDRAEPAVAEATGIARFGLQARDLSADQRQRLGLDADEGVQVVRADGEAARAAGLRGGDIIIAVGSASVASAAELEQRLEAVGSGQTVMLLVQRGGGAAQYVTLTAP